MGRKKYLRVESPRVCSQPGLKGRAVQLAGGGWRVAGRRMADGKWRLAARSSRIAWRTCVVVAGMAATHGTMWRDEPANRLTFERNASLVEVARHISGPHIRCARTITLYQIASSNSLLIRLRILTPVSIEFLSLIKYH